MNATNRRVSRANSASKSTAGSALRMLKWLVIIALLVLILVALFLPDRSLAARSPQGSEEAVRAMR